MNPLVKKHLAKKKGLPLEEEEEVISTGEPKFDEQGYAGGESFEPPDKDFVTRYQEAAQDRSGIEEAKEKAEDAKFSSAIAQGISTMFAGPEKTNDSFYQGLREEAQQRVNTAKQDRISKLKELLQNKEISTQHSTDSPRAQVMRKAAEPYVGENTDLSGATAQDLAKTLPHLQKADESEYKDRMMEERTRRNDIYEDRLELRKGREDRLETKDQWRMTQKHQDDARKALKDMRQTPTWKNAENTLSTLPEIRNLLEDAHKEGGQSLSMLGPKVARAIANEVGVLTDQDVKRYVQNPALVEGLQDTMMKLSKGQLSDVSYDNLTRLLDISEKTAQDKMDKAITREAVIMSRREDLDPRQARFYLDNVYRRSQLEEDMAESSPRSEEGPPPETDSPEFDPSILEGEDRAAYDWATETLKEDPENEKAKQILKALGVE